MLEPRQVFFNSADGTRLAGLYWQNQSSRASLVIGHGLGEHGSLYSHVAEHLVSQLPLAVLAFDFRGHGRSEGRRGYARQASDFDDDWVAALQFVEQQNPGRPRFALGHSYGGLSALSALVRGVLPADGLILSNPALRVRMPVPSLKVAVGKVLRILAPKVTLAAPLPIEHLTRDPAMQVRRRSDPLAHSRISAPLYFGMREAAERILEAPERMQLPVLLLLSPDDPVIDAATSRAWLERTSSTDRTTRAYPERMHEPLADLGRAEVLGDIESWLRQRIPE